VGFDFTKHFLQSLTASTTQPGRLARQKSGCCPLPPTWRQTAVPWILAYAGLSAWTLGQPGLSVAKLCC